MARTIRRHVLSSAVLCAAAVLTSACSGPGGVELGHDWKGSTTFALARVDGLVTVVGINPGAARAESLAVVPQQADDTDAVSPQIVRLADGRWLVTVPRQGDEPDRRYLVNRADHVLDGLAGDGRLRRVLPGRTLVAEVAGLPDRGSAGRAASSVLVRNPADWSTRRELRVPGTVGLAASDPGASDTVCLAGDSAVSVAELSSGRVTSVRPPAGFDVVDLACPSGRPVIVGSRTSGTAAPGGVRATVTPTADATIVSVDGGRVDAVTAEGSSILIAAGVGGDTELLELDTATGRVLRRARVRDMAASLAVTSTSAGWLVYTERTVTRVDPETGGTKEFRLPGTLLDF